jgi:hypothetical protein
MDLRQAGVTAPISITADVLTAPPCRRAAPITVEDCPALLAPCTALSSRACASATSCRACRPDVGHRRARMFRVADIRRWQRRTEGGSAD